MGKGNLNYLHTFDEISKIYNIDSSTIRKQVAQGKYIIGKDVKKFGKTWIMTEECMVRTFGEHMYIMYLQELENQIAENRLKALKSGTTSAQLAAQQLNNMFAAQSGAAQIAGNAMSQRVNNAQQYAAQRTNVVNDLYSNVQANKQALLTAGAQNYAASTGYASYVNQQLANLQANQKAMQVLGEDGYNKLMNPGN